MFSPDKKLSFLVQFNTKETEGKKQSRCLFFQKDGCPSIHVKILDLN